MPPRVLLCTQHCFVTRAGSRFRLDFQGATLPEMIAAASRLFAVVVACPDRSSGPCTGSVLASTAAEALAGIAGLAGCRVSGDGEAWVVDPPGREPLGEAQAAGLGLRNEAVAKESP
jgi:hypothetical protein